MKRLSLFSDPRYPVLLLLLGYLTLGFTVLGFNRSPFQALVTSISAVSLELILSWTLNRKLVFPLSALITSIGLSLLLNYSHSFYLLFVPVLFAIGSKYVFQFKGKHTFNPAMMGVALSLLFTKELITSAPAYQWNGISSMAYFIAVPAIFLFLPRVNRIPLVVAFLATFTLQVALRAIIMRHHLPFTTLFLGTLSSPSFLLFTFFMITDPATSPSDRKQQIRTGIALAILDLLFHIRQSYYTFFYAALTLGTWRLLTNHIRCAREMGWNRYLKVSFLESGYWRKPAAVFSLGAVAFFAYRNFVFPTYAISGLQWSFQEVSEQETGIQAHFGNVYDRLDPRMQHVAKWILSIGDSASVGDFDGDGKPDLFLSLPLKRDEERAALYRNLGNFQFERVPLPALSEHIKDVEKFGLPTQGIWVDFDNDGDLDLFISYAFGSPILLKNLLKETGRLAFTDVTREAGLEHYTNSVAATFFDINQDGRLDLLIANVLPTQLPDYETPTLLNLFHLPEPRFSGDRRMFNFMHASWNNANNGGLNEIFIQDRIGHFTQQDSTSWGLPETRWSLAVGTADFNHDGWPDLYVANDFGPDDLYLSETGKHFKNVKGPIFGSIGRDTYKGMNVSIEDMDRNGWQDVYVSNVHHDLQAEGSLLWMFYPDRKDAAMPEIRDEATERGVLNERRFGWGAAIADFDNDGWMDIAQANGMVDDSIDKKYEKCPDYWYVNEKIARSAPSIHRYADMWGDVRGMCIHGKESNRLYLNRGPGVRPQFVDVAELVGIASPGNSRGMVAADLDSDGRQDLIVTHLFQGPTIYRNVAKENNNRPWIGFELKGDGKRCNSEGIGSVLTVSYSGSAGKTLTQTRELQAVNGLSAQGDRRLHFGLLELGNSGNTSSSLSVDVRWCGQWKERFSSLQIGRYQELRMGSGEPQLH
jgi:Na+-translocating ferredoxin:NAD+ oxidoreductase RnfD subunit